mmetsp:Transcript_2146/g.2906  ORF Transcript_2146/g.2906 Transcript_2146/m.2906 type:complete len:304 (+) Transcript_2146:2-913(+)
MDKNGLPRIKSAISSNLNHNANHNAISNTSKLQVNAKLLLSSPLSDWINLGVNLNTSTSCEVSPRQKSNLTDLSVSNSVEHAPHTLARMHSEYFPHLLQHPTHSSGYLDKLKQSPYFSSPATSSSVCFDSSDNGRGPNLSESYENVPILSDSFIQAHSIARLEDTNESIYLADSSIFEESNSFKGNRNNELVLSTCHQQINHSTVTPRNITTPPITQHSIPFSSQHVNNTSHPITTTSTSNKVNMNKNNPLNGINIVSERVHVSKPDVIGGGSKRLVALAAALDAGDAVGKLMADMMMGKVKA